MEALQLYHQYRGHDQKHQWDDSFNRALALRTLLDSASNRDRVAVGQLLGKVGDLWRELLHDRIRLHVVTDARLQRNRGKPRAPPYGWLLYLVAYVSDRTEWHRLTAQANELQVPQCVD